VLVLCSHEAVFSSLCVSHKKAALTRLHNTNTAEDWLTIPMRLDEKAGPVTALRKETQMKIRQLLTVLLFYTFQDL
jgi:hypothetical protein